MPFKPSVSPNLAQLSPAQLGGCVPGTCWCRRFPGGGVNLSGGDMYMGRDQEELIRVILNTLDKLENKLDKLHEKLDNSHSEVSEVGLRVSKLEGQVGGIRNLFKFLGSVVAATAGSIIYMIYELVTGK